MAANDLQLSRIPVQNGEVSIQNTDGTNDFTPGMLIMFDSTNGIPSSSQYGIGCIQCTAGSYAFGVSLENIAHNVSATNKGAFGRAIFFGVAIGRAVAGAANAGVITAGNLLSADAAGQVKVQPAATKSIGQAYTTTAAQGDQVLAGFVAGINA